MTTPKPPKKDVFISYARKDGRDAAAWLRTEIESNGLRAWQDVISLPPGDNWWQQIREAIEGVHTMVLVLTEGAMQSSIVKREWAHARKMGTVIIPVTTELNFYDRAPRWLAEINGYILNSEHPDYSTSFAAFIERVRHPQPPAPLPFMAPLPPLEFTPRPAYQTQMIERLLNTEHTEPRQTITTLVGQPGIGKSTLAQAICYEQAVTEAYTGGVLFLEIGESAQQIDGNALIVALGGAPVDQPNKAPDRLRDLLEHRTTLIVFDDVWDETLIRPYLGIPGQSYLITTRHHSIAALDSSGSPITVGEMSSDEAVELLLAYVPDDKRQPDSPDRLRPLAERLGEWPLLLNGAGRDLRAEMAQRSSLNAAIAWVMEGLDEAGLGAGSDFDAALDARMASSFRRFTKDEVERLRELAIFRDDVEVPEAAAQRLWQGTAAMTPRTAGKLLRRFSGQFFLRDAEGDAPIIRFHDALRTYLGNQLGTKGAQAAHAALLRAYTDRQPESDWPQIAGKDNYLREHLVYHLRGARQIGTLQALFATPAWRDARYEGDGYSYSGYVADVMVAWDEAQAETLRQIESGDSPHAFAQCVRYALIRTSINSLAAKYMPEMVARAVELGVWTTKRGLSMAEHTPNLQRRIHLYSLLLELAPLNEAERQECGSAALATIRSVNDDFDQAEGLAKLIPHLPDNLRTEARDLAFSIFNEWHRPHALVVLIPFFPREILANVQNFISDTTREAAFELIAPHLPESYHSPDIVDALNRLRARNPEFYHLPSIPKRTSPPQYAASASAEEIRQQSKIGDEYHFEHTMSSIRGRIPPSILADELALAQGHGDSTLQAETLAWLLPMLSLDQRISTSRTIYNLADSIRYEEERAEVLIAAAPYLPAELLPSTLEVIALLKTEYNRATKLAILVKYLPPELEKRAIEVANSIAREDLRTSVHTAIAEARSTNNLLHDLSQTTMPTPQSDFVREYEHLSILSNHEWITAKLRARAFWEREFVLSIISGQKDRFLPPFFPIETLAHVARHLVEICSWAWA